MIRYTLAELDAMQNKYDLKLGITNEQQLLQMQQAHALQEQEVRPSASSPFELIDHTPRSSPSSSWFLQEKLQLQQEKVPLAVRP